MPVVDDLPIYLSIQAALIWIATQNVKACREAFEAVETLERDPLAGEDDKVTVWVPVRNLGLTAVSVIIAKYRHPDDRIIRDKCGTFEVLDDGGVRLKGKKRDTAPINYEYAPAERALLGALRAENITAYASHPDNSMSEVNASLWWWLEFKDEKGKDCHYHVVATATGKEPLRDISFKTDEILQQWPPKGGRKRGCKTGKTSPKALFWNKAKKLLDEGKVQPEYGAAKKLSKLIAEEIRQDGYTYQPDTIYRYIKDEVKNWEKPKKAA